MVLIRVVRVVPRKVVDLSLPGHGGRRFREDGVAQVVVHDSSLQLERLEAGKLVWGHDDVDVAADDVVVPWLQGDAC